jgi:hypothetical protein
MSAVSALPGVAIDPVIAGRTVPSLDRAELTGVDGSRLADVGQAPPLMVQGALLQLRRDATGVPPDPEIFAEAAELFADAEVAGETRAEYERRVVLGTGLAASTVHRATRDLVTEVAELPETTRAELPGTDLGRHHRTRWVPAGRVFAAVMASNHPAPNSTWVQALYHGYRVLVRPGARDPFTARRLLNALIQAGLPADRAAFVPCSHAVAEFLLAQADRGIVYGGDDAVRKWQGSGTVTTRGPGRTKALLDSGFLAASGLPEVIEHLALAAAYDGGVRCNNLSAVLTDRPVSEVADALAQRLGAVPVAPATDPQAVLPVMERARAQGMAQQLEALYGRLKDHTTQLSGPTFVEFDDGSTAVRPVVLSTDDPQDPAIGLELPFPFVVVAPWDHASGVGQLRGSLVANLLTRREGLIDAALREPTIRKVTRGLVKPWAAKPGIPHDGNYTQFLLEPKGLVDADSAFVDRADRTVRRPLISREG